MSDIEAYLDCRYAFHVYGRPAPQGSKHHVGNGVMIENSEHLRPWREDVRNAALAARGDAEPLNDEIYVKMVFTFTRPRSHFGTGRNAAILKPSSPTQPWSMPDLSKLIRSTEDAITHAKLWSDDARVVEYLRAAKVYELEDPMALAVPGATIRIYTPKQRVLTLNNTSREK